LPVRPGDVFTPQAAPFHRYIILTRPDADGNVLVANLTSINANNEDQGCRLEMSDYPSYIKNQTTVRFNKADLYQASGIVESHSLKINEPVPPDTLKKIQRCGSKSINLKKKYRKLLADELGIALPEI
jgi:hypothetical protein